MSSSLIKDTLRTIQKTKGRFFSIFAIVALGVAFFSGIMGTAPTMRSNADMYFDETNFMDYRIVSNFGITNEDIQELRKVDGVEAVEPAYFKDVLVELHNAEVVFRLHSIDLKHLKSDDPNYINQLVLLEGRLPEKSGEIVVERGKIPESGAQLGDVLTLKSGDKDALEESLLCTEYTVVGVVYSPYYLSFIKGTSNIGDGSVSYYAYIPIIDFDMEVYTEAYLTIKGAKEINTYDEAYFEYLKPVDSLLASLGEKRSEIRRNDILAEAYEKYNEGLDEYNDGLATFEKEMKDAEKKIEDGKYELLSGEMQLQSKKDVTALQLELGQQQIDQYKGMVDILVEQRDTAQKTFNENNATALTEIENAKASLTTAQADVDAAQIKVDDLTKLKNERDNSATTPERKLEIETAYPNLDSDISSANNELSTAKITLELQKSRVSGLEQALSVSSSMLETLSNQIDSLNQQIKDGEQQLIDGKATAETEFAKAEAEIEKGKKDLLNAQVTLEIERKKAEKELADAKKELDQAKIDIELIEEGKWYVLDRESQYGYMDYKGAADRMESIATVFPVFFYLVAALVCLTTMTRMVDEQRSQIGTLKALGYTKGQIAFKYIFYAVCASLGGSIVGLLIGMTGFPAILYTVWLIMYTLPSVRLILQLPLMLVVTLISVLVITAAAMSACYASLMETPALLMRPKAPQMGKPILLERMTFIWKRFSFTAKVTARNIFRYKKRFLMTVIGISGCTALLVAGFGIKDSISDIVVRQFGNVFKYDSLVRLEDDLTDKEKNYTLENLVEQPGIADATMVSMQNIIVYDGKQSKDAYLTVVNDLDQFKDFVSLHDRKSMEEYALSSNGVIISERISRSFNLKVGDEVEIENADGLRRFVKIDAICENYVEHYFFMSSSAYKSAFGYKADQNTFLVKVAESYIDNQSEVASQIKSFDEVSTLSFNSGIKDNFNDMISSLNLIVIILVVCAGGLAFIVLYNLTNVNISERLREIATLKVLGFHDNEVKSYVYYENIILTFIGALVGLFLGTALLQFVMIVVELENLMFGREIHTISYIVSIVITVAFAYIVNMSMSKKLREIPMVESLKSVE